MMGTDAAGKGSLGRLIPGIILFLILSVSGATESIYVADHRTNVFAFDVVGDTLVYRQTLTSLTNDGIDLAMDVKSKTLFRSAEFTSTIDLINAQSMTRIKTQTFSGPALTGIVYDDKNNRLLGTERNTNHLYIFSWDAENQTLTLQNPYIELAFIRYACDVAIKDDILYVSEYHYDGMPTITVLYVYDMALDFAYLGQIEMGDPVVSMDYGIPEDALYGGAWAVSTQLVKYPLDSTQLISKSIGISPIGLCASRTTPGRVFITTSRTGGTVEIWDTADWESNPNQTIAPTFTFGNNNSNGVTLSYLAGLIVDSFTIDFTKTDDVQEGYSRGPEDTITYTISWDNTGDERIENVTLVDYLPEGVNFDDFVSGTIYQSDPVPADPNIVFALTEDESLSDITLPVGQSITVYLTKETTNEDIYSFYLEANISDPNLGWIDNTEYDPNDPNFATAEILAAPRTPDYDYYGPGYADPQGIQFSAVSFGDAMQDGDLASFIYTATEPGYVVLSLVNYDQNAATLEEIIIRQTDPNDPNNIPQAPIEPQGDPVSHSSIDGIYDQESHTVIWELGDIAPNGSGSVSFSVIVNYKARPGLNLHNVAKLISGSNIIAIATEYTLIDCWDTTDPNIIFVDKTATGNNNGTSWTDAYTDLQDALYRAENTACENVNTIYVAQGQYHPGTRIVDSFVIPDGVSVYGGFKAGGCDFEYRNPKFYVTTLTGYIDPNTSNDTVVIMGNETLLNGVVVRDSDVQGILGNGITCSIFNCRVTKNKQFGILAENSNVELKWCLLDDNKYDGIRHFEGVTSLAIENCQIIRNGQNGIYDANSVSIIRNNVICGNGSDGTIYFGIWLQSPKAVPIIHNNTIAYNHNEAFFYLDEYLNYINLPDIQNCIIWYNNDNGEQFAGYKPPRHYSCIFDPNNADGANETIDSNGNFSHKPDFAYPYPTDPNVWVNIHLAPDSFCKEKGNPNNLLYTDQNDMDAEYRVADGRVDVGADEISCDNVYNVYDWNADGLVNLGEFKKFSQSWLAHDPNDPALLDPNDPMYDEYHDPNSPYYISPKSQEQWHNEGYQWNFVSTNGSMYSIDVADLLYMLDDSPWLWTACWRHDIEEMQQQMSMFILSNAEAMMASVPPETSQLIEAVSVAPVKIIPAENVALPVETATAAESVEAVEFDPIAEREQIVSLLEDITVFIDTGGEDAQAWQEIKDLLEQSLTELEEMAIETTEF
jgi:uncharacterized repeat protein (TIGR01451 family)